ncbi:MAG TPA: hypothetical protein VMB91_02895, partial [Solirubrobacteraceae bacterium]|nr:hypothetical protein [Solirubrobacteraceae bacterium]
MRLATRPIALALAQAELVSRELGGCELVAVSTGGDRGAPAQDKSRWVDEIERALLDGRADLAVHSAKDLPGELAEGLELVGAPARGAPEDVLCGAVGIERLEPVRQRTGQVLGGMHGQVGPLLQQGALDLIHPARLVLRRCAAVAARAH